MLAVTKLEVYPKRALFGGIELNFQLRNGPWRRIIQDSWSEVLLNDLAIGCAYHVTPEDAREVGRGNDFFLTQKLLLDPAKLQAIEEHRNGRPLDLDVRLVMIGLNLDPNEAQPRGDSAFREMAMHRVRIEKSKWVEEFLPTLGLDGHKMWELRFPHMVDPETLESETESLGRAIHDYNQGDYKDAFLDCREMVEKLLARKQELDLGESVGTDLWGRVETLMSAALHARTGGNINRADAEFAITLAQGIHRRVAQALANPKRASTTTVSLKP